MVYASSGLIQASDINTQIAAINAVFGLGTGSSGYGGKSTNTVSSLTDIPTVSTTDIIQSSTGSPGDPDEWSNMRNALEDMATHQGSTLPVALPAASVLEVGDTITFYTALSSANVTTNMAELTTNKNVADGLPTATPYTNVRGTSWTTQISHVFTMTFADEDAARHYFNTGGNIFIDADITAFTVNDKTTAWDTLLNANSYTFDTDDYFALDDVTYSTLFDQFGGGAYGLNNWVLEAKSAAITGVRGAKGSVIEFRSRFVDGHADVDVVDGTFTSYATDNRYASVFPISAPTYASTTNLTLGGN